MEATLTMPKQYFYLAGPCLISRSLLETSFKDLIIDQENGDDLPKVDLSSEGMGLQEKGSFSDHVMEQDTLSTLIQSNQDFFSAS